MNILHRLFFGVQKWDCTEPPKPLEPHRELWKDTVNQEGLARKIGDARPKTKAFIGERLELDAALQSQIFPALNGDRGPPSSY